MKAPELTDEIKRDMKILQMRSVLDPKRFYKKNDRKAIPKYFQVKHSITVLPAIAFFKSNYFLYTLYFMSERLERLWTMLQTFIAQEFLKNSAKQHSPMNYWQMQTLSDIKSESEFMFVGEMITF